MKQQVKQQGEEMNAAQERLVDLFAERTPQESMALIGRWQTGLLIGATVLAVLGAFLYTWSVIAGIVAHVLAVVALFLWWQIRRQRSDLETMAKAISGGGVGGRQGRGGGRGRRGRRRR